MMLVLLSTDTPPHDHRAACGRAKALLALVLLVTSCLMNACSSQPHAAQGKPGPVIDRITASTNSFSIDCAPTAVTVTARVTGAAGIRDVLLWYRVGDDRTYQSTGMSARQGSEYQVTVRGASLPPDRYGAWEFYITAEDQGGNRSQSPTNTSVQFLPCVSH